MSTGFQLNGQVKVQILDIGVLGRAPSNLGRDVLSYSIPNSPGCEMSTHDTSSIVSIAGRSTLTVAVILKPVRFYLNTTDPM